MSEIDNGAAEDCFQKLRTFLLACVDINSMRISPKVSYEVCRHGLTLVRSLYSIDKCLLPDIVAEEIDKKTKAAKWIIEKQECTDKTNSEWLEAWGQLLGNIDVGFSIRPEKFCLALLDRMALKDAEGRYYFGNDGESLEFLLKYNLYLVADILRKMLSYFDSASILKKTMHLILEVVERYQNFFLRHATAKGPYISDGHYQDLQCPIGDFSGEPSPDNSGILDVTYGCDNVEFMLWLRNVKNVDWSSEYFDGISIANYKSMLMGVWSYIDGHFIGHSSFPNPAWWDVGSSVNEFELYATFIEKLLNVLSANSVFEENTKKLIIALRPQTPTWIHATYIPWTFIKSLDEALSGLREVENVVRLAGKANAARVKERVVSQEQAGVQKRGDGVLDKQVSQLLKSSPENITAAKIATTLNKNYVGMHTPTSASAVGKTNAWKNRKSQGKK